MDRGKPRFPHRASLAPWEPGILCRREATSARDTKDTKIRIDFGCYDYTNLFRVSRDGGNQNRYSAGTAAAWYKQAPHRHATFSGLDDRLDDRARYEAAARVWYRPSGASGLQTRP